MLNIKCVLQWLQLGTRKTVRWEEKEIFCYFWSRTFIAYSIHIFLICMYAKNGFIDKVWALFMGHTVPYTFVFKPQIYVLDLPLSYGHSYLYALCMRVINLKYKIQMSCSKYIYSTSWIEKYTFVIHNTKCIYSYISFRNQTLDFKRFLYSIGINIHYEIPRNIVFLTSIWNRLGKYLGMLCECACG